MPTAVMIALMDIGFLGGELHSNGPTARTGSSHCRCPISMAPSPRLGLIVNNALHGSAIASARWTVVFAEIGRAIAPHVIPFAFHGEFYS